MCLERKWGQFQVRVEFFRHILYFPTTWIRSVLFRKYLRLPRNGFLFVVLCLRLNGFEKHVFLLI